MPKLLSGGIARSGGSGQYITLNNAQPQLPATETTETGFTVVTDKTLVTTYRSSLGYLQFSTGTITNQLPGQNIVLNSTGTATVVVLSTINATSINNGALQVKGGLSVKQNIYTGKDIHISPTTGINVLTIGGGYQDLTDGKNNIAITGQALPTPNSFPTGHENIVIGYDALQGISLAVKSIAIGRLALSSGTGIINSIAIGDSALRRTGMASQVASQFLGIVTRATYNGYFPIMQPYQGAYGRFLASFTTGSNVMTVQSMISGSIVPGTALYPTDGPPPYISGIEVLSQIAGTTGSVGTYLLDNIVTSSTSSFDSYVTAQLVNLVSTATQYPSETVGTGLITLANHGLSDGQSVRIEYFSEPDQWNEGLGGISFDQDFFAKVLDANTFAVYNDSALTSPSLLDDDIPWELNAPIYISSSAEKNIAIGCNAGENLSVGKQNFFIGDNAAPNFTTGSYNFFIGPSVAQNMTYGNGIIGIGSDNLVDGIDNQINIGSVFYYDGFGYTQLNSDVGLGLGYVATSTEDAALAVLGGVGISDNIIVGSLVDSTATTNGAAVVYGGAGIGGSVFIGGGLDVSKGNKNVNLSPVGGNVIIEPTIGGGLTIFPNARGNIDNTNIGVTSPATGKFTTAQVTSAATSTSTNTGALTVVGGVGINGNMFIKGLITGVITTATNIAGGARGSVPYQSTAGNTSLLAIGNTNTILVSNGTTPLWTDVNSLLSNIATSAANIFVNNAANATYYVGLTDSVNTYSNFDATIELTYNNITHQLSLGSTTSATSTVTGALHVAGGVGIEGSVYSAEGGEYENNLLYVPRVFVSTSTPFTARVGDFWVEPNSGVELQYIVDGTQRIWIQFAGL
jgi:hypothetical protein